MRKHCDEAILLFENWCKEAERAILCWLWLARDLGVCKDIRVAVAQLIWDDKAVWSERPVL